MKETIGWSLSRKQPLPQFLFVKGFIFKGADGIVLGNVAVEFRIPHLVVNAVENAGKLMLVQVQGVPQAKTVISTLGFPGMVRGNCIHVVGVVNAPFIKLRERG
jgi:hypothetical protein